MPPKTILIVDDESVHRLMLRAHLEATGFHVLEAHDGRDALDKLDGPSVDLMLLDLKMPRLDGLGVIESLNRQRTAIPTIIMTAYSTIDSALQAGGMGVKHYLTKPLDTDELLLKIEEVLSLREVDKVRTRRATDLTNRFDFGNLLGQSPPMLALKEMLALVAPSEATVLIMGESGTGKELVAQAIVNNSPRKDHPFITINCAALPDNLLESELFGHEKGAFTGAGRRKPGRFELADTGTLFLDEIGEMALNTQAKLLRALEAQSFERLGGSKTIKVDVRLIAATNRDLELEIENLRFREDLYYRLNVVQVHVPNLRDRGPDDIRLLAEHLLMASAERNHREKMTFSPKALKALQASPWPGNVRELVNAVERAVILARSSVVELQDLPLSVQNWSQSAGRSDGGQSGIAPGMTIKEVEAELISRTLIDTGGNRTKASAMLGITRQTLLNKIKEYDLSF